MLKKSLIFSCIIASYLITNAQTKYSNEFLSIGVGARALAMSGAVISSTNDAFANYWNPAGLTNMVKPREVAFMHSEYFAGIAQFDYFSFAAKSQKENALSISMVRFGVDNIPNTSQLIDAQGNIDYDKVTAFSAIDYAFLLGYSRKTKIEGLSWGINAKVIRRLAGDFGSSWGFGIDASAMYRYKNWRFALVGRDITTTFNAWSYKLSDEMIEVFTITGNEIPKSSTETTLPKIILGAARKFNFGENFSLLAEINLDMTTDGKRNVLISADPVSIDPHAGIEFGFKKIIFLRAGIGNMQKEIGLDGFQTTTFQPNVGMGISIKNITIDYALSDVGNQSMALYSNVFSIKFRFNTKNNMKSYEDK